MKVDMNEIAAPEPECQSVLMKIENEYDLQAYDKALADFLEDPVTYALDEVEKTLKIGG